MGPETDIKQFMKPHPPNSFGSTIPECDCIIHKDEIRQAELDIQQELKNRQVEKHNEPNRYKRDDKIGHEVGKEALYRDNYEPIGLPDQDEDDYQLSYAQHDNIGTVSEKPPISKKRQVSFNFNSSNQNPISKTRQASNKGSASRGRKLSP